MSVVDATTPEAEPKYKYVSLTLKKQDATAEDGVNAIAELGQAAQQIEGWEIDTLSVNNWS